MKRKVLDFSYNKKVWEILVGNKNRMFFVRSGWKTYKCCFYDRWFDRMPRDMGEAIKSFLLAKRDDGKTNWDILTHEYSRTALNRRLGWSEEFLEGKEYCGTYRQGDKTYYYNLPKSFTTF